MQAPETWPAPPSPDADEGRDGRARSAAAWLGHRAAGILNMLVPPVCLACHVRIDAHDALCAMCWRGLTFIRPPFCDRLGLPLPFDAGPGAISAAALADPPDYRRARAIAHYSGTMRRLVHDKKYRDRHEGRRLLGRLLIAAGQDLIADADVIIPVPLAYGRLLRRRYNQSAELARLLSAMTRLPCDLGLLVRRRATRPQVGLSMSQRQENVAGAFAVPKRKRQRLQGRRVLLIDDVVTTGATVNACARALTRSGAAHVDVLALALASDISVTTI